MTSGCPILPNNQTSPALVEISITPNGRSQKIYPKLIPARSRAVIVAPSCPLEGVVARRCDGGMGCGACARDS
jgi:hypothetical protein